MAAYLTNRSFTSVLEDETPAELWYGEKPSVSNLRVFGCRCYVHVPKCKRGKMEPKSYPHIMVGYSGNGYRLWDAEQRKIVLSRDDIFDEVFSWRVLEQRRRNSESFSGWHGCNTCS